MTTTAIEIQPGAPLTALSEEEQMFQQSVRDFAVERIRPLVHDMDHSATMSPDLIKSFFELGIMGIEVPEQFGGAGSSFFNAVLVVEELSHVDASCGVLVDVQNTLMNTPASAALVIQSFWPFSTQWSPLSAAFVASANASDPEPASDSA